MNGLTWGLAAGYLIAHVEIAVRDIYRAWRAAKAKVNEVRQQHGQPPEKRWWRL